MWYSKNEVGGKLKAGLMCPFRLLNKMCRQSWGWVGTGNPTCVLMRPGGT